MCFNCTLLEHALGCPSNVRRIEMNQCPFSIFSAQPSPRVFCILHEYVYIKLWFKNKITTMILCSYSDPKGYLFSLLLVYGPSLPLLLHLPCLCLLQFSFLWGNWLSLLSVTSADLRQPLTQHSWQNNKEWRRMCWTGGRTPHLELIFPLVFSSLKTQTNRDIFCSICVGLFPISPERKLSDTFCWHQHTCESYFFYPFPNGIWILYLLLYHLYKSQIWFGEIQQKTRHTVTW